MSGMSNTIVTASAPLSDPHAIRCCHVLGIWSSFFIQLSAPMTGYIESALPIMTMSTAMTMGTAIATRLTERLSNKSPISMNTIEFTTKAKYPQNFSMDSSTRGDILYRP